MRILPALVLAAGELLAPALAQTYPARPIRIVVPFPAGGTMDFAVRTIAREMKSFAQPIIVENKPGGGTVLGVEAVAKAAPDGYTLVCVGNSFTVNQTLVAALPYDTLRDFRPIGLVTSTPNVLVGNPGVSANSLRELVDYAKANPGKLSFASVGNGTIQHLAGETFKRMAGIDMLHVPYKGQAPAMNDLLGGQVNLMIGNLPDLLPQIRAGKLKPYGVTTSQRAALAPDLPTIAEQGYPGFETYAWFGLLAPARVPDAIVSSLNGELVRVLALPEVKAAFVSRGFEPRPSTQEEFAAFLRAEIAKYARVIKDANVKLD